MVGFMRSFLRLPGAHLLSRPVVVNAAILLLQCARFYGERVELVETVVKKRARLERSEPFTPFMWSLLPKRYRRKVDDMRLSRVDNSRSLSSDCDIQSLLVIELDPNDQSDAEANIEVETILNPIEPNVISQELEERAAQLRKRLDEPCSSEMAFKLQKELNEVLMRLPYTPEGIIYDLDREYTVSELGSAFSSLSSEHGEEGMASNKKRGRDSNSINRLENENWKKDSQEKLVRPKRKLQDLDEYFKSDQLKKKQHYSLTTAENEVDGYPEADQSDDQSESSDVSSGDDDMFESDSGNEISTENDESMNVEIMMAEEQNNLASCEQIILNECQNNDGEATMANVIESEPSSSGVSQFFMAALTLASEQKVKLEDKGEQGKPTTKEQLGVKLSRNP